MRHRHTKGPAPAGLFVVASPVATTRAAEMPGIASTIPGATLRAIGERRLKPFLAALCREAGDGKAVPAIAFPQRLCGTPGKSCGQVRRGHVPWAFPGRGENMSTSAAVWMRAVALDSGQARVIVLRRGDYADASASSCRTCASVALGIGLPSPLETGGWCRASSGSTINSKAMPSAANSQPG
jgi:hypothetical protein